MKPNVVLAERSARIGLGLLLLASPLLELPTYPFNLLGLVLIATAALGYCPLYQLLFSFRPERAAARPAAVVEAPAPQAQLLVRTVRSTAGKPASVATETIALLPSK